MSMMDKKTFKSATQDDHPECSSDMNKDKKSVPSGEILTQRQFDSATKPDDNSPTTDPNWSGSQEKHWTTPEKSLGQQKKWDDNVANPDITPGDIPTGGADMPSLEIKSRNPPPFDSRLARPIEGPTSTQEGMPQGAPPSKLSDKNWNHDRIQDWSQEKTHTTDNDLSYPGTNYEGRTSTGMPTRREDNAPSGTISNKWDLGDTPQAAPPKETSSELFDQTNTGIPITGMPKQSASPMETAKINASEHRWEHNDQSTMETVKEKISSGAEAVKDKASDIASKIRDATFGKNEEVQQRH